MVFISTAIQLRYQCSQILRSAIIGLYSLTYALVIIDYFSDVIITIRKQDYNSYLEYIDKDILWWLWLKRDHFNYQRVNVLCKFCGNTWNKSVQLFLFQHEILRQHWIVIIILNEHLLIISISSSFFWYSTYMKFIQFKAFLTFLIYSHMHLFFVYSLKKTI